MTDDSSSAKIRQHWEGHIIGQLAARWPEFVHCESRLQSEIPFLNGLLSDFQQPLILDAAMGIGCEVIWLTKEGYTVFGNEIEDDLIIVARTLAKQSGVEIKTTSCDWRNLVDTFGELKFDVVLLLGNSFALLQNPVDREKTAEQLFRVCKDAGLLIVDERNFRYIMDNKESILAGQFRYGSRVIYCGKAVSGRPTQISKDNVRFGYFDKNGPIGTLDMHPFNANEIRDQFLGVGFKPIDIFSDFDRGFHPDADFYTYTFRK